ncbi:phosphonate C-P lyase system protein PhnG [Sinorhizobium meliloti]|nr:phosphonate C-P lyase system protein PhnG [Sinorhizobium meliloti]RVO34193.1 phosphonate C-P lyase system protein PhnG [Sinorhizobium meliloti]
MDSPIMKDHAELLETLARANVDVLKAEAEAVLPQLGDIEVIENRSGLVMLPMRDTVTGSDFYLGEVLTAEAHIRLNDHGAEGYGMVTGRDLERAMAMAVIDAALDAGVETDRLGRFVDKAAAIQRQADDDRLRRIEATRVEMETL